MDPLVSTAWLAERLGRADVQVLDGSWWMPAEGRSGHAEYLAAHIPGAAFFDIDAIADHSTDLPHMLPSPEAFAEAAGRLGLRRDATVVQLRLNPDALQRWLKDPLESVRHGGRYVE